MTMDKFLLYIIENYNCIIIAIKQLLLRGNPIVQANIDDK
jgi:hypothetical protein